MSRQSSNNISKKKFTSAQQVYDCALNLLSYRDYSNKKIFERLQQKGADEQQAKESIVKLEEYGLLDEQRYADRVYEAWLAKRCYGRKHLQAELLKRGVRSQYIEEIMARFTPELECRQAENAAAVFIQRNQKKIISAADNDPKIYAAAVRFMAARGFSTRYMYILRDKLHFENEI